MPRVKSRVICITKTYIEVIAITTTRELNPVTHVPHERLTIFGE